MRYLLVILFIVCQSHSIISKNIVTINRTILSTIYFQFNSTNYRDSLSSERYQMEYAAIKELIEANPEITFGIHGYQNSMERTNVCDDRAQKVKQDLIKVGACQDRLIVKKEPAIPINESILDAERELTQKVVFRVSK